MRGFVQLTGPQGTFYVRPCDVCSIGHADLDTFLFPEESQHVRLVTTTGGSMYYMFNDQTNMDRLMREAAEEPTAESAA